jgi:hypothetical protein
MRRSLPVLAAAAALVLGGVAVAGPAAAASNRSVHTYGCAGSEHPGLHTGWDKQPSTERRNVGGTCPGPE